MLYPLKFYPVYKDYIWGGRNLEKLGKTLPEGIVAESWEISCHQDGVSVASNGRFTGVSLPDLIAKYGRAIIGSALSERDLQKFPLLVKFIDANDILSVQVHPGDEYARLHENGEYGKNEMWYIMSAEPGATIVYDVIPGITRDIFRQAVQEDRLESCFKKISVAAGDVINIPEGLVHAIGKGIMLAEIQQNSNTTYRVYDYNRTDKNGNRRQLHIEKALDVIDFNSNSRIEKSVGLEVALSPSSISTYAIAGKYFCVEICKIDGIIHETADGSRFYVYVFTKGEGVIEYDGGIEKVKCGESVLIPASIGKYSICGNLEALKSYVPDIAQNVITPLKNAGYSYDDIYNNVGGLR